MDESHIAWLKRYLQEYDNAFILISHDIPFLNSVINLIYHMENQKLDRYVGDYDNFQRVYEAHKKQLEAAYKAQQQEMAELADFVQRNKARVSTRNMAMSRQKKLDKMEVIELAAERPKPQFHFKPSEKTSSKLIFETKGLVIGYETPLSQPLDLLLERGQKVALVGANGIGKTTLLRSLLGEIAPLKGEVHTGQNLEVGYFEQEAKPSERTCIEEVWQDFKHFTQYEVRAALAKCGLTTKHIESKVMVLSGGEKAKVRLCKLLNRPTNVLVLDEPTNHLDVDAKDELKRALQEYRGTILLICHEPEFYRDVVTDVWNCEKWTTKKL